MDISKPTTRIKMICAAGASGPMAAPQIMDRLLRLVPSRSGTIFWISGARISNVYDPLPEAPRYGTLYINEFIDKRDADAQPSFTSWLKSPQSALTTTKEFVYKNFYKSSLYHEVLHPMRYHHSVMVALKDGSGRTAMMMLHREAGTPQYTQKEKRVLMDLRPHLAHALQAPDISELSFGDEGDSGILVFDKSGTSVFMCPMGRRLLSYATRQPYAQDSTAPNVTDMLLELCKRQTAILEGSNQSIAPPVWRHDTAWGRFIFRARPLEVSDTGTARFIGITVQLLEPQVFRIMRQCEVFELTPRQTEICVQLAQGKSYEAISRSLSISIHTVIDHIRKLFARFEVASRSELVATLVGTQHYARPRKPPAV